MEGEIEHMGNLTSAADARNTPFDEAMSSFGREMLAITDDRTPQEEQKAPKYEKIKEEANHLLKRTRGK